MGQTTKEEVVGRPTTAGPHLTLHLLAGISHGDYVAIKYTGWYVKEDDQGMPMLGDICDPPKGNDKLFKFQMGQACMP